MLANPAVSVIVPSHNGVEIGRMARSIQLQTFRDWEMIIVVDRNPEGEKVAREMAKQDSRIRVEPFHSRCDNGCGSFQKQYGISIARGNLISVADDDDLWLPNHLATLFHSVNERSDIDAAFSRMLILNRHTFERNTQYDEYHNLGCALARKETYRRYGGHELHLGYCDDNYVIGAWKERGANIAYVPTTTWVYFARG